MRRGWDGSDALETSDTTSIARTFLLASRSRHARCRRDWSSDVCSSDLEWLAIDDIPALLDKFPGRDPVEMLKQVKVTLHAGEDDGDLVSRAPPLLKWIAFETRDGGKL